MTLGIIPIPPRNAGVPGYLARSEANRRPFAWVSIAGWEIIR